MPTAIEIENLGKKYSITAERSGGSQYVALRDVLAESAKSVVQRVLSPTSSRARPRKEDFWAVKDLNLKVEQGDKVAIIGHNGAGKSTLLKLLSQITEPTTGHIKLYGRVSSLLEVGTGFHPELTGRENIYLNGSILGMSHAEVRRKFDEIVAFSGVEKFLETPVKRYSSGMRMRLGFAVAAHLESEILIIDEVLAVGDAEFQKKCLGKMDDISREGGRTILFVSHNMSAVQQLCNKGIVLNRGQLVFEGKTSKAIHYYEKTRKNGGDEFSLQGKHRDITLVSYQPAQISKGNQAWQISFTLHSQSHFDNVYVDFAFYNEKHHAIIHEHSTNSENDLSLRNGNNTIVVSFPNLHLNFGSYKLSLYISTRMGKVLYHATEVPCIFVEEAPAEAVDFSILAPAYHIAVSYEK